MKKKYLLTIFIWLFPYLVLASPIANITVNNESIEKGKSVTVTVTLSDVAAWNIKIEGNGSASCMQKQTDVTSDGKSTTKQFDLTCTSTKEGTINISVTGDITSESGETKDVSLTKTVTVTKEKSSDNALKDLKINGSTISGFSSSKTSYSFDTNETNINISATANDSKASVSGIGSKSLKYGSNSFNITVTAENGAINTYIVTVNRQDTRSSNTNLKSLTIDKGSISFDKNTTSYLIELEHDVNEINISASADDSKASVSGTGTKTLQDYKNEFNIVVTAENGTTKTYTVTVNRKDSLGNFKILSADNSVKSIIIPNYDFKFNNDTKKYNVLVDEEVNNIEFNIELNDGNAKVDIIDNNDLKPGLNIVKVKVTAENGDINEFLFNVYKIGEEIKEEPKKESKGIFWIIISIIECIALVTIAIIYIVIKKKSNKTSLNQKIE